jgi:hypothetical protein
VAWAITHSSNDWAMPFGRRHVFAAAWTSFSTISLAIFPTGLPLSARLDDASSRTLSIGFDIRRRTTRAIRQFAIST